MTENTKTSTTEAKSTFGVRLERGIVTHWQDTPITSYEMAEECREQIMELLGERGEVERVYALT